MYQSDRETLIHCTEKRRFRRAKHRYVSASIPFPTPSCPVVLYPPIYKSIAIHTLLNLPSLAPPLTQKDGNDKGLSTPPSHMWLHPKHAAYKRRPNVEQIRPICFLSIGQICIVVFKSSSSISFVLEFTVNYSYF
jgi:hypothetical protein